MRKGKEGWILKICLLTPKKKPYKFDLIVSGVKKKVLEDQKPLCLMPTLLVSSCYLLSGLVHQRGDTSHLYQQT